MSPMRVLADEQRVRNLVEELAVAVRHDIDASGNAISGPGGWALVGIRSRGDVLAQRLADHLGIERVGTLDITLYRDDLSEANAQPIVRTTEIPFAITGLNVVLIDDVLMTGRSIRAALTSLLDLGRAKRVWLAVLVDRGGRELPISADHAALDLRAEPVAPGDVVEVNLTPTDESDQIVVGPRQAEGEAAA